MSMKFLKSIAYVAVPIAAIAVVVVTACTGVRAQEADVYSIRIAGVSTDGVMIPPTPSPTPTRVPSPTPVPKPVYGSTTESWRWLVEEIFPWWAVESALAIMQCESGGNPWAIGAQGELGLFQIHPRWHSDATLDPRGNVLAAARISHYGNDWRAWTCSRVLS